MKKFQNLLSKNFFFSISILVFLTTSNTIYSLYFLKKNDKPHLTEILTNISQQDDSLKTYVVISNSYLLNYATKKSKFKELDISFISCERLNSLKINSWWEITIFPGDRFMYCNEKLKKPNKLIKKSNIKEKVKARYAEGNLMVSN